MNETQKLLAQFALAKNITQDKDLAAYLGVTASALSLWKSRNSIKTAKKTVLKVDPNFKLDTDIPKKYLDILQKLYQMSVATKKEDLLYQRLWSLGAEFSS